MATKYWVGGTGNLDGSDTTHISNTSGGAGGATYPTSSDDLVFDGSSGGGTVTVSGSPNFKSITCGAFTGTLNFGTSNPTLQTFSLSGSGVRTIALGSGTWTITGNNATVWSSNIATNLTFSSSATLNFTYSGSTGTRSINSTSNVANLGDINISAGSDAVTLLNVYCTNISFSGYTGAATINTFQAAGNITFGLGMTVVTNANNIVASSTSTGKTFTTNGVVLNQPIVFNGVGGGWTLQDDLDMSGASVRTLTLTAGTLDANGKNVTCGAFASSNSNTRTLTMGSGTWTISGSNATIWDTSTTTNLTFNRGGIVNCTYSGGAGIRTVIPATSMPMNNLRVSAGNDVFSLAGGCNDLDFTGFTGTLSNPSANLSISGSLTFGSGMTVSSGTGVVSLTATTTGKTITMNGVAFNRPITFNGVGGGWTLQDALNMDGASPRALGLTAGDLNTNGMAVTCGSYSSNNSNVRSLTLGTSIVTLTGTGTIWNNGGANSTCSMASSTIVMRDASSSTKSLSSGTGNGSGTFGTITLMPGGSGSFTFNANARTINTLNVSGPKTVVFTSGTTTTITTWNVNGLSGSPVNISATTPGSAATISVASGIINSYRLSLQDITATGGATFNAIASINVSGNTGWNFIYTRGRTMNRVAIRNIPHSLVLDGSTGYIEYGNHAAYALGTAGGMSIRFKLAPQQVDTSAANSRFLGTLSDGTLNNFITFIIQNTSPYALVADVRSGGVSNTTTSNVSGLMDGRWYDAAIGWDANGTKLWLLGAVVGINGTPATSSLGATPNLVSGRLNSGINGRYLTGNLQGLRLFSSKPTDEQIADLHLKGITPSNQVAYWPDDEGSGTSLAVVGSGNAGALTGGVSWSSTDTPQKSRTAMSNRIACSSRVTTY